MKRSEAVAIIANLLEHEPEMASDILHDLEKVGMLPPPSLTTTLGQWEEE